MATKEQILERVDQIISAGEVIAPFTPFALDDLFVRFLKWARNDESVLEWLERFVPPAEGALTAPPEVLLEALRRFKDATGSEAPNGSWIALIQLVMQLAAELQKLFGKKGAA